MRVLNALGCAIFVCGLLTGCVSKPAPDIPASALEGRSVEEAKTEQKAWRQLLRNSKVRQVGQDRLLVQSWGSVGTTVDVLELRLLARAGAEANKLGKSHFAIVHIRDRSLSASGGLFDNPIYSADEQWIGTYEDLVRNRYERDYSTSPVNWLEPGLTAVVIALDKDEITRKSAFNAWEMYASLNRDGFVR